MNDDGVFSFEVLFFETDVGFAVWEGFQKNWYRFSVEFIG